MTWLPNGTFLEHFIVKGEQIQDLEIEPLAQIQPSPVQTPVDPAILSFARPSVPLQSSSVSQVSATSQQLQDIEPFNVSPPQSNYKLSAQARPSKGSPWQKTYINTSQPRSFSEQDTRTPAAVLTEPFNDLALNSPLTLGTNENVLPGTSQSGTQQTEEVPDHPVPEGAKSKSSKRGRKKGIIKSNEAGKSQEPSETIQNPLRPMSGKGKGNMTTPLAQSIQNNSTPIHDQYLSVTNRRRGAKNRQRARRGDFEDQNGWATEEVTDIQDMGDFDFEGNLSKFDKRKVFEQIRQEDTTVDEARLVSFNRLTARPGTHGGKNLHFTENVLDSPKARNFTMSSSESDLDVRESRMTSSRNSHRNLSRASTRLVPSRKGSGVAGLEVHTTGSGSLPDITEDRLQTNPHSTLLDSLGQTSFSYRATKDSGQRVNKGLRTVSSSRDCPCLTPLQMMELEQLVVSRFGLTDDMITENAGSAIAQTARRLSTAPEENKSHQSDVAPRPFIVILTGNHKTASRAISAARHLRNHSAQIVLCLLGLEREGDLLDDVRRQLNIFRVGGGKAIRPDQLMQRLKGSSTNLIVDALLGIHFSFHDLRYDDQAAYLQLLRWSNSMNTSKLSIDIPSGVDASTGKTPKHSFVQSQADLRPITNIPRRKSQHECRLRSRRNGRSRPVSRRPQERPPARLGQGRQLQESPELARGRHWDQQCRMEEIRPAATARRGFRPGLGDCAGIRRRRESLIVSYLMR